MSTANQPSPVFLQPLTFNSDERSAPIPSGQRPKAMLENYILTVAFIYLAPPPYSSNQKWSLP
jgi:hypothetical protein